MLVQIKNTYDELAHDGRSTTNGNSNDHEKKRENDDDNGEDDNKEEEYYLSTFVKGHPASTGPTGGTAMRLHLS